MGRGEAAKATPRIRNKITNKTRLRIVHGDIETDRTFVEDVDATDGKNLASGVDAEDANEYHLQAILAAANLPSSSASSTFCQPSTTTRKTTTTVSSPPPQPLPPAAAPLHIPTPDATGKVSNFARLYSAGQWENPKTLTKSSNTVEESVRDALANGCTYVMDERDADWLDKNNKLAKGEGSSNSATSRPESTPRRSAKSRGKDPESISTIVISEDEFEIVIGLFEKVAEEKVPWLHLSLNDFPPFSEFESFFSTPIPAHYFPSYTIPYSVPPSSQLLRLARIIYPYWRDRKTERGGRRIIPQLNYDESNEGDPYVCFRRREVKPVRKTRRQDTTSIDRMVKLKTELDQVQQMAHLVLDREQEKVNVATEFRSVHEARARIAELKRKHPIFAAVNDDDLFTERLFKKPRLNEAGTTGMIKIRRHRDSLEGSQSGQGTPSEPPNPHQRAILIAQSVENTVARHKNPHWEDVTEAAFQPPGITVAQRHFRPLPDSAPMYPLPTSDQPPLSTTPPPPRVGRSISYRSRIGRGGRVMLDRRLPPVRHPLDAPYKLRHEALTQAFFDRPSRYPDTDASGADSRKESATEGASSAELRAKAWKTEERWRYDADAGVPIGGGLVGALGDDEEDQRLIVDDYDPSRTWHIRKHLLTEEDLCLHTRIDDLHFRKTDAAYEARQEKAMAAAGAAIELAEKSRREQASRNPQTSSLSPSSSTSPIAPLLPPTPNGAAAAQSLAIHSSTPSLASHVQVAAALAQAKKARQQQLLQAAANGRVPNSSGTQMLNSLSQLPNPANLTPQTSAIQLPNGANTSPQQTSPVASATPSTNVPLSTGINGVVGNVNGSGTASSSPVNGVFPVPPSPQSQTLSAHPPGSQSPVASTISPRPTSQTATHVNGIANGIASNANAFVNGTNGVLPNFPTGPGFPMAMRGGAVPPSANGAAMLSSQQASGLKTMFASLGHGNLSMQQPGAHGQMPSANQLASGFTMSMGVNGFNNMNPLPASAAVANLNLAMGNGNIPLKLPMQRQMQLAAGRGGTTMGNGNAGSPMPNVGPDGSPVLGMALPAGIQLSHAAVNGRGSPRLAGAAINQHGHGRASPNGMLHHPPVRTSASPLIPPQIPHSSSPMVSHSNLAPPAHQHHQVVGGPNSALSNAY